MPHGPGTNEGGAHRLDLAIPRELDRDDLVIVVRVVGLAVARVDETCEVSGDAFALANYTLATMNSAKL